MNRREGKYGPIMLISTVIGTVIGSGIFFKTEKILEITEGNTLIGLFAFLVGGGVMLICAGAFASLAGKNGGNVGIVGYAEEMCGRGYAQFVAMFSADFYFPSMTAILSRVSAEYLCASIGLEEYDFIKVLMAGVMTVAFFALNTLAPQKAAIFQIASTAVKLLPLVAVGAIGCAVAVGKNSFGAVNRFDGEGSFLPALLSAAFAYEGWISVMSLGKESDNARKNIPKALAFGSLAVFVIYAAYYIGLVTTANGDSSVAFENLFGNAGGRIMMIFVTVSCLGALNGLTMSTVRGHYILSEYVDKGHKKGRFSEISESTGVPVLSGIMGLLVTEMWLIWSYVSDSKAFESGIRFFVDPAEVSVSVMYGIYIPIFLSAMIKNRKKVNLMRGFLLPMAVISSAIMLLAAPFSFGHSVIYYLAVLVAVWTLVLRISK